MINHLIRDGKRYRAQRAVGEALVWLGEYYCDGASNFDRLERAIALLETGVSLRLVMSKGKKATLTPFLCSSKKRISFGLKFFVKGVRARIKHTHVTLTEAIFEEVVAVEGGANCFSASLKKDHLSAVATNMVFHRKRARVRPY